MRPRGAREQGKSTCAGATEGVRVSFCVRMCMWTEANLLPGGSTRISIIRGLLEPPLNPCCFTPLSQDPRTAQPTIHLILRSLQPLLPPSSFEPPAHSSIHPSISLPLLYSISHPTSPFIPLTSSSYAYPYHCLRRYTYLAQRLGITSSCLGRLNFGGTRYHSLDVLLVLEKKSLKSLKGTDQWQKHRVKMKQVKRKESQVQNICKVTTVDIVSYNQLENAD